MKPIPLLDYVGSPILWTFFALLRKRLALLWCGPIRRHLLGRRLDAEGRWW